MPLSIPRRRKSQLPPSPTRKRLQTCSSAAEVYNWGEILLSTTGQGLSMWRKGGGDAALKETEKQLHALLEVCAELRARDRSRL